LLKQQGRFLGDGAADIVECLTSRIQALATSHDLLVRSAWTGADIEDLVHRILAPWADDARFTILGPAGINLSPKQAQGLVLGLHELATNAVKYGALSTSQGEVTLLWSGIGNTLQLNWTERGGPLVTGQPTRTGFGTRLLERMLPAELGPQASVQLRYEPSGLSATIRVPIAADEQALVA
jgi:two-component sensor histidine kinase